MKRLVWLLLVASAFAQYTVPYPSHKKAGGGGAATFNSIVQETSLIYATDCNFGGPTNCTKTITSTGSGNLLVVASTRQNDVAEYIASITSGLCSGSWQFPAGSQAHGSAGSVAYAYCLSSISGQTSITVTYTNWQGRPVIRFYEISYTGTPSLIASGANYNSTNNTSQTGIALTLSGATAYATCQLETNGSAVPTAVTSPYSTDFIAVDTNDHAAFAGFSCALNNSSGTAPTWTQGNTSATVSGIAFGVN